METFLLDKRYKFVLEMIHEVSKKPEREVSFSELTKKLKISNQTIKAYSQTLVEYCELKNLKTFSFENGKMKKLSNTNFNIFDLYHFLTLHSVKYQILMAILNNPEITLTNLYLNLSISQSKCTDHISQLNEFFSTYLVKINFLRKRSLEGETHQLRFLIYNIFLGMNHDDILPTSPKLESLMASLQSLSPTIVYSALSRIKLHFYIYQITSQHGYHINPELDFLIPDSPFISYSDFFDKLNEINFLEHCSDSKIKERESRYLYFILCRTNVLTLENSQLLSDKIICTDDIRVLSLITQFQTMFQITLSDSETKCLSYNLSLFFKEASIFRGRAKTFDLEKLVGLSASTVKTPAKSIQIFLEKIYVDTREIQILIQNFPSLHLYCTLLFRVILAKHQHPLTFLVQSNISTLHREVMISQIKDSAPFPITVCTVNQLDGKRPDAIISNWLPDKKYEDVPFFSISHFYREWNKDHLSKFLNQLVANKGEFYL